MKWVIPAAELTPADRSRVGGKAYVLSLLDKGGFAIPKTLCIPTEAYSAYIDQTGLRERIRQSFFGKIFRKCVGKRCGTARCASGIWFQKSRCPRKWPKR